MPMLRAETMTNQGAIRRIMRLVVSARLCGGSSFCALRWW